MHLRLALGLVALAGCQFGPSGSYVVDPPERAVFSVHEASGGPLTAVPFERVTITDPFWAERIETNRTATVKACLDKCDETGRIRNFAVCATLCPGEHQGYLYNDSDVYKVLEGVAYTLASRPESALEARADAIIDQIVAAQQPDGYLNTYWTLVEPGKRWTNIRHGHELYCAGHMIEGAIAYFHATGKRKWLDCAIRFADHIDATFGPGKKLDATGHEELELALVKLFHETDERRYLSLAQFFLDQRGSSEGRTPFGEYAQDHEPIREQREVVGHAVRAMYLYCAMADVAGITGDPGLWTALDAIWHDVVDRKMYVTGGIGPSASNEGFTVPYDLPNDTAYCETCAAIGMALWNQRMFLATGDAKYADIVERELYNGFLSGVSLDGTKFFYDNPLASKGQHERVPWFDCSCCPSNVVRFLPAIGERIYATRGDVLFVSQYIGSRAEVELGGRAVKVTLESGFPWQGDGSVRFSMSEPSEFEVRLRWPDWATGFASVDVEIAAGTERIEPQDVRHEIVDGFLSLRRTWRPGDRLRFVFPVMPRLVAQDERVASTTNRRALRVGPLVYCAEGVDNDGHVRDFVVAREDHAFASAQVMWWTGADMAEDVRLDSAPAGLPATTRAFVLPGTRVVLRDGERASEPAKLTVVPYFLWANRGKNEMAVWLPIVPELAELPGEGDVVRQAGAAVKASHCWQNDTPAALNDGRPGANSADESLPRLTFWDHRGTNEWVEYEFDAPRRLEKGSVQWFDDTGRGSCRVPASWRLTYWSGDAWAPVEPTNGTEFGVKKDVFNHVTFTPIEAQRVRLEIVQQEKFSSGILEWRVE
ncbi:MAG: glycoside hydrolase family 127 protein [Planctomycetes bacterium]|nr:glycoside hydrolase family 127 protein [Planctomycetota bacterium]